MEEEPIVTLQSLARETIIQALLNEVGKFSGFLQIICYIFWCWTQIKYCVW